jgi:hypothetical protein
VGLTGSFVSITGALASGDLYRAHRSQIDLFDNNRGIVDLYAKIPYCGVANSVSGMQMLDVWAVVGLRVVSFVRIDHGKSSARSWRSGYEGHYRLFVSMSVLRDRSSFSLRASISGNSQGADSLEV